MVYRGISHVSGVSQKHGEQGPPPERTWVVVTQALCKWYLPPHSISTVHAGTLSCAVSSCGVGFDVK